MCKALGVEFSLACSGERVLMMKNIESRVADLVDMVDAFLQSGMPAHHECFVLRGKLGFADSFLRGRLGSLV